MVKICDTKKETILLLGKERARLGHIKYGDRDKLRDGALDMIEEVLDIINILERRLKWIHEEKGVSKGIEESSEIIFGYCHSLIGYIKKFDYEVRKQGIEVDDTNGGERWGMEILKKKEDMINHYMRKF